jgi:hypothetical protein
MFFPCRDLTINLTELEEGKVSSFNRFIARIHLTCCTRCREYARQLRLTRYPFSQSASQSPQNSIA